MDSASRKKNGLTIGSSARYKLAYLHQPILEKYSHLISEVPLENLSEGPSSIQAPVSDAFEEESVDDASEVSSDIKKTGHFELHPRGSAAKREAARMEGKLDVSGIPARRQGKLDTVKGQDRLDRIVSLDRLFVDA